MSHSHHDPLYEEIMEICGQDPSLCYQCGKCSAGCPVREYAVDPPNRVVRYVQLGFYDKALESPTIWLCAGCLTCSGRCPQGYDLARFMDAMRQVAIAHGIKPPDRDAVKFHEAFLNQIKLYGKAFELGLVGEYKLKTGNFFQDVDIAPEMFFKGKIGLVPHMIKGKEKIIEIFEKTKEAKK